MAENEPMPVRKDQVATSTILVVINDLKFNEFLVEALKIKFACEVLSVTKGRSALETVKSIKPDLLIIDYQLPDLNALELSDRLHGIKELASVPTIIINLHMTSESHGISHRTHEQCDTGAIALLKSEGLCRRSDTLFFLLP